MQKIFILFFIIFFPIVNHAQSTESQIPFTLDSDADGIINVIDTDDDNDGVLDNLDFAPLNPATSTQTILSTIATVTADAGLRNNSASSANQNFGTEALPQTKNIDRSLVMKFVQPANLDLTQAILTVYTNDENDALQVFFLPSSTWFEVTAGANPGITYSNNLTNFNARQLLGTTAAPSGGKYTFSIPLNIFSSTGGNFTILVFDPNDPTGAIESLKTKETSGAGATVEFKHRQPNPIRVISDQSAGTKFYANGPNQNVGFKLAQAPTSTVYLPIELTDTTKAKIIGSKVLVFNTSNWNVFQNISIDPLAPGNFDIAARPLHGNDVFYNGSNPHDLLNYVIQATDVVNLSASYSIATGSILSEDLNVVSAVGSTTFKFKILSGPTGLSIVENSGLMNFHPLMHQIGTHTVMIEVTDDKGNTSMFTTTIIVTSGSPDPVGKYVVPYASTNGNGTAANPYNDIPFAVAQAALAGGGNVFVRGGVYNLLDIQNIGTAATAANPIVIQPLPGETVKFDFGVKTNAFEFLATSRHIEFTGFEIDGGTDNVDFWCLPAQAFWGDQTVFRGGGIAIGVNGENLTIRGNYIHNCYQKGVEIRTARYLKVYDNIIHSIATTSLSGGHGIMRQQSSGPVIGVDNGVDYRWDLMGNLIFNVEQRIYSWVPSKGFIDMVLDEGKPILIDDPSDAANVAASMKARITNNVVAYGAIDQIRLKSTNNLTVSNNTVYSAAPAADGITDKIGDTNVPQFTNTKILGNAVQTQPGTASFELGDIIIQGNTSPNTPPTISGNVAAFGNVTPNNPVVNAGVTSMTTNLFVDANGGNFRLNTPNANLGVRTTKLDSMDVTKAKFGVTVKWDQWNNDHLKLTQTILDNIPGINDGITGNETVFTNFGTLHLEPLPTRSEIDYEVVNGTWKTTTGSPGVQKFELHPDYAAWYNARNTATKNLAGADYERIRWGNSVLKQNQLFDNDWLTVSTITADTNTVILGKDEQFTLDGDILIDFEGFTPAVGEEFDLMKASSITSVNGANLFDRVLFEGYTPSNYSLSVVNVQGGQVLRLKILNTCSLMVISNGDSGGGTLRDAVACAVDGDIITLSSTLEYDTIKLLTTPLLINKNLSFVSAKKEIYLQNCTTGNITTSVGKTISMTNFYVLTDSFVNNATLNCTDMTFRKKDGTGTMEFKNNSGAVLNANSEVRIE
jgi:hypothetical protein